MSVSSNDFFAFADECLPNKKEINYRNFISRNYYGMFHAVSSKLAHKPNYSESHHSSLINYLSNASHSKNEPYDINKLKSLAYILRQEKLKRAQADYDLNLTIDEQCVGLSKKNAR